MVRETRHLWVGNLPENISEERIREHFKRYGPVQSVKFLSGGSDEGICAAVAFVDICSAAKAHKADHRIEERLLKTTYYEPSLTALTATHYPSSGSAIHRETTHYTPTPTQSNAHLPHGARSPRFSTGLNEDHNSYERSSHFYESRRDETIGYNGPGGPSLSSGPGITGVPGGPVGIRRVYPGDCETDFVNSGRGRVRAYPQRGHFLTNGRAEPGEYRWNNSGQYRYHSEAYTEEKIRRSQGPSPPPIIRNSIRGSRQTIPSNKRRLPTSRSGSESPSSSRSSRSSSSSSTSSSSSRSSSSRSGSLGHSSRSNSRSPRRVGNASQSLSVPILSSTNEKRSCAICVKNLPPWSSDNSLKDGLFHDYKKHGKVTMVRIFGTGADRYAIVCFRKFEDTEKALDASQDKQFFGVKIQVSPHEGLELDETEFRASYDVELDEYHPKATRTLFIGGLDKEITVSELRTHFEPFGEIIEIDIKKQNSSTFAFCQYSDIRSVVLAVKKMDGEHLGCNRIKLGFGKSMPNRCIWVGGISDALTDTILCEHFSRFGTITHRNINRDKGHALIAFERESLASVAVNEMRGCVLSGKKLQIDFASRECQEAFFDNLKKQEYLSPTDSRTWERRDVEKFEKPRRAGDGTFIARQISTQRVPSFTSSRSRSRYDSFEEFTSGRNFEEFADDSFERDLHEYAGRQRFENGPSTSHNTTPTTPTTTVKHRSFSPIRKREERSPHSPRSLVRESDGVSPLIRPFEEYESRKSVRHRSTSDQESFHSQSPPPNKLSSPRGRATSTRMPSHSPSTPHATSPSREVTVMEDRNLADPRRRRPSEFKDLVVKVSDLRKPSESPVRHRNAHRIPSDMETDELESFISKSELQDPRLLRRDEVVSSGDEKSTDGERPSKKSKYGESSLGTYEKTHSVKRNENFEYRPQDQSSSFRKPFETRKNVDKFKKDSNRGNLCEDTIRSPPTDPRQRKLSLSGGSDIDETTSWRSRESTYLPISCDTEFLSDASPPGTPVRDEREDPPSDLQNRRIPPLQSQSFYQQREKLQTGPLSLPLPKFAQQFRLHLSPRGSSSSPRASGLLRSPTFNSPSNWNNHQLEVNHSLEEADPVLADTPVSPGPAAHDNPSDSEESANVSPSNLAVDLYERIKALDEKYEKWTGTARSVGKVPVISRPITVSESFSKMSATRKKRIMDFNELRSQEPSAIVKSLLSKRSVFDEDSERLENVSDKYEPKPFTSVSKTKISFNSVNSVSYSLQTATITSSSHSSNLLSSTILPIPSATPLTSLPGIRVTRPSNYPSISPVNQVSRNNSQCSLQGVSTSTSTLLSSHLSKSVDLPIISSCESDIQIMSSTSCHTSNGTLIKSLIPTASLSLRRSSLSSPKSDSRNEVKEQEMLIESVITVSLDTRPTDTEPFVRSTESKLIVTNSSSMPSSSILFPCTTSSSNISLLSTPNHLQLSNCQLAPSSANLPLSIISSIDTHSNMKIKHEDLLQQLKEPCIANLSAINCENKDFLQSLVQPVLKEIDSKLKVNNHLNNNIPIKLENLNLKIKTELTDLSKLNIDKKVPQNIHKRRLSLSNDGEIWERRQSKESKLSNEPVMKKVKLEHLEEKENKTEICTKNIFGFVNEFESEGLIENTCEVSKDSKRDNATHKTEKNDSPKSSKKENNGELDDKIDETKSFKHFEEKLESSEMALGLMGQYNKVELEGGNLKSKDNFEDADQISAHLQKSIQLHKSKDSDKFMNKIYEERRCIKLEHAEDLLEKRENKVKCNKLEGSDYKLDKAEIKEETQEKIDRVEGRVEKLDRKDGKLCRNDKFLRKEYKCEAKESKVERKDDQIVKKVDHILRKEDHIGRKEDHIGRKEDHIGRKEDHIGRKEDHIVRKEDQNVRKDDKNVRKENQNVRKVDQSLRKEDQSLRKEDQSLRKEDLSLRKEDQSLRKEDQSLRKEDQSLRKEDQSLRKEDQSLRKEDQSLRKEDQSLRKEDQSLRKENKNVRKDDLSMREEDQIEIVDRVEIISYKAKIISDKAEMVSGKVEMKDERNERKDEKIGKKREDKIERRNNKIDNKENKVDKPKEIKFDIEEIKDKCERKIELKNDKIEKKEHMVERKENTAERNETIERKIDSVEIKEDPVERKDSKICKKEVKIERKDAKVERKEVKIERKEDKLERNEDKMHRKVERIDDKTHRKEDKIERRDDKVERRDDKLERREDKIERKEDKIERKEDKTERKEDKTERKEDKIERKEDKIERKEDKIERKEDKNERKEDKIERKEDKIERKEDKIERKEDKIERKEDKIERKEDKPERKEDKPERKEDKPERKEDKIERKEDKIERKEDKIERKEDKIERKEDKSERKEDKSERKEDKSERKEDKIERKEVERREGKIERRDKIDAKEEKCCKEDNIERKEDKIGKREEKIDKIEKIINKWDKNDDKNSRKENKVERRKDDKTDSKEDKIEKKEDKIDRIEERTKIKDERLKLKEERIKSKDERIKSKEEKIKLKEDRMKVKEDRIKVKEERTKINEEGGRLEFLDEKIEIKERLEAEEEKSGAKEEKSGNGEKKNHSEVSKIKKERNRLRRDKEKIRERGKHRSSLSHSEKDKGKIRSDKSKDRDKIKYKTSNSENRNRHYSGKHSDRKDRKETSLILSSPSDQSIPNNYFDRSSKKVHSKPVKHNSQSSIEHDDDSDVLGSSPSFSKPQIASTRLKEFSDKADIELTEEKKIKDSICKKHVTGKSEKVDDFNKSKFQSSLKPHYMKSKSIQEFDDRDEKMESEEVSSEDELKSKGHLQPGKRTKQRATSSSSSTRRGRPSKNKSILDTESDSDDSESNSEAEKPKKPSYFDVTIYDGNMYDKVKARRVRSAQKPDEDLKQQEVKPKLLQHRQIRSKKSLQSPSNAIASETEDSDRDIPKKRVKARINSSSEEDSFSKIRPNQSSEESDSHYPSSKSEKLKKKLCHSSMDKLKRSKILPLSDITTDEDTAELHNARNISGSDSDSEPRHEPKESLQIESDSETSETGIPKPPRPALSVGKGMAKEKVLHPKNENQVSERLDYSLTNDEVRNLKSKITLSEKEMHLEIIPREKGRKEGRMKAIFGLMSDDSDSNAPPSLSLSSSDLRSATSFRKGSSSSGASFEPINMTPPNKNRTHSGTYESDIDDDFRPMTPDIPHQKLPLEENLSETASKDKDLDTCELKSMNEMLQNIPISKDSLMSSTWRDSAVKEAVCEASRAASDSGKGSSSGVSTASSSSGSSAEELLLLESNAAIIFREENDIITENNTMKTFQFNSERESKDKAAPRKDKKKKKKHKDKDGNRLHRHSKESSRHNKSTLLIDESICHHFNFNPSMEPSIRLEEKIKGPIVEDQSTTSKFSSDKDSAAVSIDNLFEVTKNSPPLDMPLIKSDEFVEEIVSPTISLNSAIVVEDRPTTEIPIDNKLAIRTEDNKPATECVDYRAAIKSEDKKPSLEIDVEKPVIECVTDKPPTIATSGKNLDQTSTESAPKLTVSNVTTLESPSPPPKPSRSTISQEETLNAVAGLLACYNDYQEEASPSQPDDEPIIQSEPEPIVPLEDPTDQSEEAQKAAQMLQSEMPEEERETEEREQNWASVRRLNNPQLERATVPSLPDETTKEPEATPVAVFPSKKPMSNTPIVPEPKESTIPFPDSPSSVQSEPVLQIDEDELMDSIDNDKLNKNLLLSKSPIHPIMETLVALKEDENLLLESSQNILNAQSLTPRSLSPALPSYESEKIETSDQYEVNQNITKVTEHSHSENSQQIDKVKESFSKDGVNQVSIEAKSTSTPPPMENLTLNEASIKAEGIVKSACDDVDLKLSKDTNKVENIANIVIDHSMLKDKLPDNIKITSEECKSDTKLEKSDVFEQIDKNDFNTTEIKVKNADDVTNRVPVIETVMVSDSIIREKEFVDNAMESTPKTNLCDELKVLDEMLVPDVTENPKKEENVVDSKPINCKIEENLTISEGKDNLCSDQLVEPIDEGLKETFENNKLDMSSFVESSKPDVVKMSLPHRGRGRGRGRRGTSRLSETTSLSPEAPMLTRSCINTRHSKTRGRGRIPLIERDNVADKVMEQPRRSTRTKRARKHPDMVDHEESTNRRKRGGKGGKSLEDLSMRLSLSGSDVYDFHDSDEDIGVSISKKGKKDPTKQATPIRSPNKPEEYIDSGDANLSPRKSRRLKEKIPDEESFTTLSDCETEGDSPSKSRGRSLKDVDDEDIVSPRKSPRNRSKTTDSEQDIENDLTHKIDTGVSEIMLIQKVEPAISCSLPSVTMTPKTLIFPCPPTKGLPNSGTATSTAQPSTISINSAPCPNISSHPVKLSIVPTICGVSKGTPVTCMVSSQVPTTQSSPTVSLLTVTSIPVSSRESFITQPNIISSPMKAVLPIKNISSSAFKAFPNGKKPDTISTPLVDPVTGHLTPMKMLDEGHYIPIAGEQNAISQRVTLEGKDKIGIISHSHGKVLRAVLPSSITVTSISNSNPTPITVVSIQSNSASSLVTSSNRITVANLPKGVAVAALPRGSEVSVELVSRTRPSVIPFTSANVQMTTAKGITNFISKPQNTPPHSSPHATVSNIISSHIATTQPCSTGMVTMTTPGKILTSNSHLNTGVGSPRPAILGVSLTQVKGPISAKIQPLSTPKLVGSTPSIQSTPGVILNSTTLQSNSFPNLTMQRTSIVPGEYSSHLPMTTNSLQLPSNSIICAVPVTRVPTASIPKSVDVRQQGTILHSSAHEERSSPHLYIEDQRTSRQEFVPHGPHRFSDPRFRDVPVEVTRLSSSVPVSRPMETEGHPHMATRQQYDIHAAGNAQIRQGARSSSGPLPSHVQSHVSVKGGMTHFFPGREIGEIHKKAGTPQPLTHQPPHGPPGVGVECYLSSPPLHTPPSAHTPPPAHHHNPQREGLPINPAVYRVPYIVSDPRSVPVYGDKISTMTQMPIDLKVIEKPHHMVEKIADEKEQRPSIGSKSVDLGTARPPTVITPQNASSPHHLPSPHYERSTDSPQVTMMYSRRYPHYEPNLYPNRSGTPGIEHETLPRSPVHMPFTPIPSAESHHPTRIPMPGPQYAPQVQPPPQSLQAENYMMQEYPFMWDGVLELKNEHALVKMHFLSGSLDVARGALGAKPDFLKIVQRMRLEHSQLDGVARKMQMEEEHCILMALPLGRNHYDLVQQQNHLANGFIKYLGEKRAAGIVNVYAPGTSQSLYVIHIFPPCEFANDRLNRIAPELLQGICPSSRLLVVIATC